MDFDDTPPLLFMYSRVCVWGMFWLVERVWGVAISASGWWFGRLESVTLKTHNLEVVRLVSISNSTLPPISYTLIYMIVGVARKYSVACRWQSAIANGIVNTKCCLHELLNKLCGLCCELCTQKEKHASICCYLALNPDFLFQICYETKSGMESLGI